MRYKLLPVTGITALLFLCSCTTGSKTVQWTKGWCLFSSGPAYACYGVIGIILLLVLVFRLKKKGRKQHRDRREIPQPASSIPATATASLERELEQKLLLQEDRIRQLEAEKESLRRRLAEAEQFARSGEPKAEKPATPEVVQATNLYFLQPAGNCFPGDGRVETIAEAVYELVCRSNKPAEASFSFVDTPQNVSVALPHEESWSPANAAICRAHIPAPYAQMCPE